MQEIRYALRRFARHWGLGTIKVVTLGIGFAVSFIMLAKVVYEHSFDQHFVDVGHTYRLRSLAFQNGEPHDFPSVSGAIAPGMYREIPQVEAATRFTGFTGVDNIRLEGDRSVSFDMALLADSQFFDIFDLEVLEGDPHRVLSQRGQAMISRSLATRIGGDVVGVRFAFPDHPETELTIGGVYEDIPLNASERSDILVAMPTIGAFTWDGSDNWIGNDRYTAYVRLSQGTTPEDIRPAMREMQEKYQNLSKFQKEGMDIEYPLVPARDVHLSDETLRASVRLIGIIAIVVLVMSLLNYMLLRISSIIGSLRATAIMKCMGAERYHIQRTILMDTLLHLVLAIGVGGLFVFFAQELMGELLDVPVGVLITPSSLLVLVVILALSTLIISIGPGRLIARTSPIVAMGLQRRRNRGWKLALLFVEAIGATFLVCTVYFVDKQYDYSLAQDQGYQPRGLYLLQTSTIDSVGVRLSLEQLRQMPEVEGVSLNFCIPYEKQSGDNIYHPDGERELFNITDFFWADEAFVPTLGLRLIEGSNFTPGLNDGSEMLISQSTAVRLIAEMGWRDGVIGKPIKVTSHNPNAIIVGVYEDVRSRRANDAIPVPQMSLVACGAQPRYSEVMSVRMRDESAEALERVAQAINRHSRYGDVKLLSVEEELRATHRGIRQMGYYTLFGSILALVISAIGIIGYSEEEVTSRSKELAIRKVNGASLMDIVRLFIFDYLKVACAATFLAFVLARRAIGAWQAQFSDQVPLGEAELGLVALGVLLFACATLALYCAFASSRAPIRYLRDL